MINEEYKNERVKNRKGEDMQEDKKKTERGVEGDKERDREGEGNYLF